MGELELLMLVHGFILLVAFIGTIIGFYLKMKD
jgi:hypothetical protein